MAIIKQNYWSKTKEETEFFCGDDLENFAGVSFFLVNSCRNGLLKNQ